MALVTSTVEIHEVDWDRAKEPSYLVVTNSIRSKQRLVDLSIELADGTRHTVSVKCRDLMAALENAMNPNNIEELSDGHRERI